MSTPDTTPLLRRLTEDDIPAALALSTHAGWNQTAADWRLLVRLASAECFAIEVSGELASTTTLVRYGRQLGWVGMVLTRPQHQGRGFARRLVTEACRIADQLGIKTLKLDATDQGKRLYESVGFRFEQHVERWERTAAASGRDALAEAHTALTAEHLAFDALAFGVDRSDLLTQLASNSSGPLGLVDDVHASYLQTRPGRVRKYLGPCVATELAVAGSLIERALDAENTDGWYWDLLAKNTEALGFARTLQFEPKRRLDRMSRGNQLRGDKRSIYALAGFEFG